MPQINTEQMKQQLGCLDVNVPPDIDYLQVPLIMMLKMTVVVMMMLKMMTLSLKMMLKMMVVMTIMTIICSIMLLMGLSG